MYELIELSKEKDFVHKFLPVLKDGFQIYSVEDKLNIIGFWKKKVESTRNMIKNYEATKTISLIKELKLYETIYGELDSLLECMTKCQNTNFSNLVDSDFEDLLSHIGTRNPHIRSEIIRIHQIEEEEIQDLELNSLKRKYVNHPDIMYAEGFINLIRLNYKKAQYYFEEYISRKQNFIVLNNLSAALYKLEDFHNSELYLIKAIQLNPNCFELYFNYGLIEERKNNHEEAAKFFLEATTLNPASFESWYALAIIFAVKLGELDKGFEYYKYAVKTKSDKTWKISDFNLHMFIANELGTNLMIGSHKILALDLM